MQKCPSFSIRSYFVYQVLIGNVSRADWGRLEYYSRKVKSFNFRDTTGGHHDQVHPLTYFRIAQLQSSALFPSLCHLRYNLRNSATPHILLFVSPLLYSVELFNIPTEYEDDIVRPFLATLSESSQMLSRIVLRSGRMATDILKKSIIHFKQLRSLELSQAVLMTDFTLWEVIGKLPFLEDFALNATDPTSHPAYDNTNRSEGPKYFDALETLCVTGSFFLIEHLLGFIDSPWLKSIKVSPIMPRIGNDHEEDLFTPSMTIITSKWSQSLEKFIITSDRHSEAKISKSLMLLLDFHEMRTFDLTGWKMENADDDVRRLVMSWPKLRTLDLCQIPISLSTLRIIAENCPELRSVHIALNVSIIPPFDTSSKRLGHHLEVLTMSGAYPVRKAQEHEIQVSRHLNLIFSYLKSIKVTNFS